MKGLSVLAEELVVIDADSPLWLAGRPFLDAALRLEQSDENYTWHGWKRQQIESFLAALPDPCSLVIAVWEVQMGEDAMSEQEILSMGVVCEVVKGEVRSICTFDALTMAGLRAPKLLEPGIEDALEIMRATRIQVAPVAWALFTDKTTWNEWVLAGSEEENLIDKRELLATFARQGRCVLMGNQTAHRH